jgi:hypothetical protein
MNDKTDYQKLYLEYKIKYINLKKKQMKGGYVPPPPPKFGIGDRVENVFSNETGVITNLRILEVNPVESQNLYTVHYDNGTVNTANDRALVRAPHSASVNIVASPYQPQQPIIIKNVDPTNPFNPHYPQTNPYNPLNPYNPYNYPTVYKPTIYYDDDNLRRTSRKKSRKSSRKSSKKSSRNGGKKGSRRK